MWDYLREPYQRIGSLKADLLRTLTVGFALNLLFALVNPFKVSQSILTLLGLGIGIVAIAVFVRWSLYCGIKKISQRMTWRLWHQVLSQLIYLVLLAQVFAFFMVWTGAVETGFDTFAKFMGYTMLYGLIPVSINALLKQNAYLSNQLKQDKALAKSQNPDQDIELISTTKSENFQGKQSEVVFLKSDENYVIVNTEGSKQHIRCTMKSAVDQWGGLGFLRIHRSYLVNVQWIEEVQSQSLILSNGLKLPISRQFRKDYLEGKVNTD